jgi:hypothetical protein
VNVSKFFEHRLQEVVSIGRSNSVDVRGGYDVTTADGEKYEVQITRVSQ